jgi:hypothetical protein
MGATDDEKLRALYQAARREECREVPSFESILASRPERPLRPRPALSRHTPLAPRRILAAVAMLALAITAGYYGQTLTSRDQDSDSHVPVVVEHTPSEQPSPLLDMETEFLLLAMGEGDSFTDFLLVDEDYFFFQD